MVENWLMVLVVLSAALLAAVLALSVSLSHMRREAQARENDRAQALDQLANNLAQQLDDQEKLLRGGMQQMNAGTLSTLSQLGQGQTALLESMQRQLLMTSRAQEERLEQLRQTLDGSMTALRQENERQLSEMRHTVDDKLTASLDKRLNDSFAQVSQRLEQVYKGLGEMQSLASGVGDLKKVLTNVKTRGIWGEMQLGSLLQEMLSPSQYAENVAVVPGSAERVEYAVLLPAREGQPLYLPIDSKFPQEDYLRLVNAAESADKVRLEECRKALTAAIRTEAKRIASKYIRPPYTTDFAVMFLPVEGLYAEVMRSMDVAETIQREQRVVIAGPSTFAALLNALQMGFRTLAIEQRSSEVWQLLGHVKRDFAQFGDTLEKTRQRLQQASDSIDSAFLKSRSIEKRLGEVETLAPGGEKRELLP